ncbi:MAG: hypothetical protein K9G49_03670 [Taibaiella sp.]|nr:hypothetical protein [Taibaiella sp.]
MPTIPFFDSKDCEWADMTVMIAGATLTKIRGLKYKATKEKQLLHAAGDEPISIQGGNRVYDGQIKVLKGALDDMNRAARAVGGDDILDLQFDIVITYKPKGTRALQTDTLIGVEVKDFEKGWEQGAKSMDVTLPIVFMKLING